jgi:hypothetical protein
MIKAQEMWWRQAASDYAVFELLRSQGVAACHPLHFLQMSTEKIAKAAFWSRNTAPAMSHVGFVSFLKKLGSTPSKKRSQLASLFEFPNFNSFQAWLPTACQLGRQIETIAPAVMPDGPNAEYPWPHAAPTVYPANYSFPIWDDLKRSQGRRMTRFIERAMREFPQIADL